MAKAFQFAPVASVRFTGGLLAERQRTVLKHSIDQQYQQCKSTGRLDALGLPWKAGIAGVPKPHHFWDSDVAKWIESAAYALALAPDAELERKIDDAAGIMAKSQRADGYFNSFFLAAEPENIFRNLREHHELYCAGHMVEAAVAYFEATGKRNLLDVLLRYVDCIDRHFGREPGKINGYDGHEEIELALMRLYRVTGDAKHLNLAQHFIDARGGEPHFFTAEAQARGEAVTPETVAHYDYFQAHRPIREQETLEGHAVRALYMLAGAIDVAYETGDKVLITACKKLYKNCIDRRMYITGGVGSTRHGERFTYDFDLPNESAYAETCAAIALIFASARLLQRDLDGTYGDIIERTLYNGVLPGISLDGRKYFYANVLATQPQRNKYERGFPAARQDWFGCACCPPNVARLLTSLGSYAWSVAPGTIAVHLYGSSTIAHDGVTVTQTTQYPWDGLVQFAVRGSGPVKLALRIPAWCARPTLTVNRKPVARDVRRLARKGYVTIEVRDGDQITLNLPMDVRRVYADVRVRHDAGRVALMRGPLVYCMEEADNGADLNAIVLPPAAAMTAKFNRKVLGGVVTLSAKAWRDENADRRGSLYSNSRPRRKKTAITAVPYFAWANRAEGEMTVWIREG